MANTEELEKKLIDITNERNNIYNEYRKQLLINDWGEYIGKYVAYYNNEELTEPTKYLYVKAIRYANNTTNKIILYGICFYEKTTLCDTNGTGKYDSVRSKKMYFNNFFQEEIYIEDLKIYTISEETWHKQFKKAIRDLNKYVKNNMDLTTYNYENN